MTVFATILGYIGTACLVLSFQFKKERTLFLLQLLSAFFFVFHYGLLGDYTGMAMDGVCFARAVMMYSGKKALTGKVALCVVLAVIGLLCVLTWAGIFSIFPTIALFVSTIFLFSNDGEKIRRAQLFCTSPAWLTYNIYVRSFPGILCETLDMGSVVVYYLRKRFRNKNVRKKDLPR